MATVYLCPISSILQYFTDTGFILSGGKINTYVAGTSTPQATYTDSTGVTANSNPIVLNSAGRLQNVTIWQPAGVSLKIVITDSAGNPIGPTFDQVAGINDFTNSSSSLANAASGSGADLVANAVRSYDLVASVRAANVPSLSSGQTLVIEVEGGSAVGDGLGGEFYWDQTSGATDDGGVTTIKPTGEAGNGRYIRLLDFRQVRYNAQSADYTLDASDRGRLVNETVASKTVTVPSGVFNAGDAVSIGTGITSGSITIAQGSGLTMYWANGTGNTTGNRTLTGVGLATVVFVSSTVAWITGAGLS